MVCNCSGHVRARPSPERAPQSEIHVFQIRFERGVERADTAMNGPVALDLIGPNGEQWHFVRYFRLDTYGSVDVGFEAQSPIGGGCVARFSKISYVPERLASLRSGL